MYQVIDIVEIGSELAISDKEMLTHFGRYADEPQEEIDWLRQAVKDACATLEEETHRSFYRKEYLLWYETVDKNERLPFGPMTVQSIEKEGVLLDATEQDELIDSGEYPAFKQDSGKLRIRLTGGFIGTLPQQWKSMILKLAAYQLDNPSKGLSNELSASVRRKERILYF